MYIAEPSWHDLIEDDAWSNFVVDVKWALPGLLSLSSFSPKPPETPLSFDWSCTLIFSRLLILHTELLTETTTEAEEDPWIKAIHTAIQTDTNKQLIHCESAFQPAFFGSVAVRGCLCILFLLNGLLGPPLQSDTQPLVSKQGSVLAHIYLNVEYNSTILMWDLVKITFYLFTLVFIYSLVYIFPLTQHVMKCFIPVIL